MNEFEKIFNEMNLDRALLPILFRSNRSTVWKYLSGDSTAPASAMSLIMLLQLIQKRNPDLLAEWLTLSDFTIPPEVYLDQPDYWKGWVYTQHKVNKNVLEYLKKQRAVTVSVADIEKYLKTEGIKVNTTTVYRYLDKLCAEHIVIKYPDLNSDKAVFQFAGEEKKCTEHLHLKCIRCGKVVHLDCDFMAEFKEHLYKDHGFRLHCSGDMLHGICQDCENKKISSPQS